MTKIPFFLFLKRVDGLFAQAIEIQRDTELHSAFINDSVNREHDKSAPYIQGM